MFRNECSQTNWIRLNTYCSIVFCHLQSDSKAFYSHRRYAEIQILHVKINSFFYLSWKPFLDNYNLQTTEIPSFF